MTQSWSQDEMHQSIRSRIRKLEERLTEIRSLVDNRLERHKEEHDELIGAKYVNYAVDNASALWSRENYIKELESLQSIEPKVDR